jgi:hypothetical protein
MGLLIPKNIKSNPRIKFKKVITSPNKTDLKMILS